MKNYINILSLIVFVISIWTVNTTFSPTIDSTVSKIKESRKDLALKQSFAEQSNLADLSKSIDSFVPEKLDKGLLINLMAKFAQESFVEIKSLDIQGVEKRISNNSASDIDISNKNSTISIEDSNTISTNTLKEINIDIDIQGNKQAIYKFCSQLYSSEQYMDILSINFVPIYNNIQLKKLLYHLFIK